MYIVLFVFSFLALYNFVFNNKWLYLDTSFISNNSGRYFEYMHYFFSSFTGETTFGFDSSIIYFPRIINSSMLFLDQYMIYALFLLLSFFICYKLFVIKYSKEISIYGGLFFVFNPISIYFFQEIGFIFAYTSLLITILGIYKYFTEKKYLYLFLSGIGFYFLLSYTRITGLYGLFLIIIGIYNFSFIKNIFFNKKKELVIFILTHILIFIPFLFAFIYPYFNGEKEYFSGLGNYASSHLLAGTSSGFYNWIKSDLFQNVFIIKEITGNFAGAFQTSKIFTIYSILFIAGILIYSNFLNTKFKISLIKYLSTIFLFIIFIKVGAKFLSQEVFIAITYKYFPFIANNTNWIFVLYIPILTYFLAFSLEHTKIKFIKRLIGYAIIIYCFLSIFPLLNYSNNPKLDTINIKSIPINYQNTFYKESIERNPSLFFPQAGLYFNWSPYPFEMGNNTLYQTLFTNNPRLVNSKQANLNQITSNLSIGNNTANNRIFNLKNVFVFKDIRNAEPGQFDFFPVGDYVGESKRSYRELLSNTGFYIKQDNENFVQFGLQSDDRYEYFLYAPRRVDMRNLASFLSGELNIFEKPIIIDPDSFHKPSIVDNYEIPVENQNIAIRYKQSVLEPTKIYAKITNFDSSKPFLLQLNQTFGMSWKVKWITKEEFEEKPCINEYKEFSITQNKVCQFDATLLDIRDTQYLDNPSISDGHHFEGNFVGNTWIVTPDDIPENMRGQKELYAVIIYEKQIYHTWALVISGLTFLILIILSIREGIISYRYQKYDR